MQERIIIAAIAENKVIGNKNTIPWHIKEDFQHFKNTTMGYPLVMGRNTFASLPGLLPGRTHLVLSSQENPSCDNIAFYTSIEDLLNDNNHETRLFICGGAQIYEKFIPISTHMILTRIKTSFEGDTKFPPIPNNWVLTEKKELINSSAHKTEILFLKKFSD